jgi:hypothetical protein
MKKRAFLDYDWSKMQLLTGGWSTFLMDDKMTWPPYVAALFGVGLLRPLEAGQETPPPEKPNSIEIFYCL